MFFCKKSELKNGVNWVLRGYYVEEIVIPSVAKKSRKARHVSGETRQSTVQLYLAP